MGNEWNSDGKHWWESKPRRSPMDAGEDRKGCPLLILYGLALLSLPAGLVAGFGLWLFS